MTDAAGPISLAEDHLRSMLAKCDTFRSWIGATGGVEETEQSQAEARVYVDALPPPNTGGKHTLEELRHYRPYAIVWTDDEEGGYTRDLVAVGSAFHFAESGRFRIRFEQDIEPQISGNPAEISRRFKNTIGQILDDLCGLAGTAGYVGFTTVTTFGPFRSEQRDAPGYGDTIQMELALGWEQMG